MEFGMPTLIELDSLSDQVALCTELDLSFIELNMNMPQYQLNALTPDTLAACQKNSPVYFTVHLDESLNIWDFNPLVSKAYFDTALSAIALARTAGIPVLNMHMHDGVYFTLPDQRIYLYRRYRADYIKKILVFRSACEAAIGNSRVKICIENCAGFTDFQQEAVDLLLESPVFGLTLDIGHNHEANRKDEAFMLARRERLCHMHIHDAFPGRAHLTLGTGEIDLLQKLALARQHHCRCVIETKTVESLHASVGFLRDNCLYKSLTNYGETEAL